MPGLVDIVLPSGEQGTVPEEDLSQAVAAGAKPVASEPSGPDGGGLVGALATGAMGASSTASFGLSDQGLNLITNLAGGRHFQRQVLDEVNQARAANPKSLFAGEAAGLLLNPAGISGAGEAAEQAVATRLGEGLLGRAASMSARGAAEGAMLGAQHQTTEDALGDHGFNGQAIFASATKDALLGAGAGAALGVGSHYLGEAAALLRRSRGPASDAVLDEIAEVPGAGRKLLDEAKQAETSVEGLRRTGLTGEQAAGMVDEINALAKQRAASGPVSSAIDDAAEAYAARAGGSAERQDLIRQQYATSAKRLADAEATVEKHALDMSQKGTKVLRNLEDTVNEVQFSQKSEQFANLVDTVRSDAQHDQVAKLLQDTDDVLKFWEGTASKGGAEGAVRTLRRQWQDTLDTLSGARRPADAQQFIPHPRAGKGDVTVMVDAKKLDSAWMKDRDFHIGAGKEDIAGRRKGVEDFLKTGKPLQASKVHLDESGRAAFEDGRHRFATLRDQGAERVAVTMDRESFRRLPSSWNAKPLVAEGVAPVNEKDLFLRLDKLKRGIDSTLQWGRENRFGLPEAITHAEMGLEPLANKMRSALEDAEVWGEAGNAQARWNASFSNVKARRDHFMDQLGVAIDQQQGLRIPEVDFAKTRSMLNSLKGAESDAALQSVKSTEAAIAGFRDRAAAIREFGELTESQAAKLDAGLKDLDAFESSFKSARTEAAAVNRLKAAALEERNTESLGGLLGLASGIVTKPLTTVQRLAAIRQTVQRTEEAIAGGLRKFFGGDADTAAARIAEKLAPRAKDKVISEMEEIRSTAGNPVALQDRAAKMVGDLGKYAPKIGDEVRLTAIRALDYLAREAPKPSVSVGLAGLHAAKGRYSDQQVSDWEAKRRAALDPESVIRDMQRGKLNRDAIKAVEFVSPKLFAKMQELAQDQIMKLEQEGKLSKMPYQQKAVISTLLKVPADQTWQPDFIAMMQAAKVTPVAESAPKGPQQPNSGVSKRAVEIDSNIFATEAGAIEQGRAA